MYMYILKDRMPVMETDTITWGQWMEMADRIVKQEFFVDGVIRTQFLGIDHRWGDGPPILFETTIEGGEHNDYQSRCCTWDEAIEMHEEAVKLVRG